MYDLALSDVHAWLAREPATGGAVLDGPAAGAAILASLLLPSERERLAVVAVDQRRRVIDAAIVSEGTAALCIVDPAVILRWVLTRSTPARAFIVAHNHPSGDPSPSAEDRAVTRRLVQAGQVVGVPLLDHLVVAEGGRFASLAEDGVVPVGVHAATAFARASQ